MSFINILDPEFEKNGMNDLKTFSDGLDAMSARKAREHEEFQTILGVPPVFVKDPIQNDDRFGIGYWKAPGGVISYRRYANGFDPYSRTEYPDGLIDLLNQVRAG